MPLAEVPVDHVVVPPDHRLARFERVDVSDLEGEPVLLVEREDAPRAHDDDHPLLRRDRHPPGVGSRTARRRSNGSSTWCRVGAGIGWLNTWQAERESGRTDVAIRPLVPVGMHDVFRIAWRAGDTSPATADVRPGPARGLRRLTRNSDLSAPM